MFSSKVEILTGSNIDSLVDQALRELPNDLFIKDMVVQKFDETWVLKVYVESRER
jgi:hypothetical protein